MCNNKKQFYGAIQAHLTLDQGPIFNESNIKNASFDAQLEYAKQMNNFANRQAKGRVDIAKATKDDTVKGTLARGLNLARIPEALLPKKVYGNIDKKMTQWADFYRRAYLPKFQAIEKKYAGLMEKAKGDKAKIQALETKQQAEMAPLRKEAEKNYKDNLKPFFVKARNELQAVFDQHGDNPKRLEAGLKKLGLSHADAYYTNEYLKHLENGGPFFNFNKGGGSKAAEWLTERVSTITGKKISFNPMTALYNVAELGQKAPATFGFTHTLNGIGDAMQASKKAKLTIFDRLPELEKAGIYNSDFSPLRPEGKYDPVARSQNLLDNVAYFIGKRGGNVPKALKEIAYRPKPWNDTFIYQDPVSKTFLNFMSFQFRHMQQYGGWVRDVVDPRIGSKQKAESAKALAVYSLMTGALFGDRAAVPAPIYALTTSFMPDLQKDYDEAKKNAGLEFLGKGVVGLATGGKVDLSKNAQPFGGIAIGIGGDMVQGAIEGATQTLPKVGKQVREGRADKAAALALSGLVKFSQLFKNGANAATQKVIDGVTKAYIDDEDFEGYIRDAASKVLPRDAVSKK